MTDPVHPEAARLRHEWTWSAPKRGEHFRRCSYCGSINPDDLAAETRWFADWADRKYGWPHKFYVDIPNRDPGRQFVISAITFEPRADETGWEPYSELSRQQKKAMREDGWGGDAYTYVRYAARPNHFAKFYTIHLADPRVSDKTRDTIAERSGLRFTFTDGYALWEPT